MSQLGRLLATKRESEKLPCLFTMWIGQRGQLVAGRKGAIVAPFACKCVAICASVRLSGTPAAVLATELQVEMNASATELVGTRLDIAAAAGAPAQSAVSMGSAWDGIELEAGDRLHLYIDAVPDGLASHDLNVVFTFATM